MDKEPQDMTLEELEEFDAQQDVETPDEANVTTDDVDTDVETPEPDVQTTEPDEVDTKPETPDYVELFKQSGLDKQYPGGLSELLSRTPETNRYLHTLQEENNRFKEALLNREKPKPEMDDEDFQEKLLTDPESALKSKGFIDQSAIDQTNKRLSEVENNLLYNNIANIVENYEEIRDVAKGLRSQRLPVRGENAVWDRFDDLCRQYQGLDTVPLETKLSLLYETAKNEVIGTDKTKPPVKPLSTQQKMAAQTAKLKKSSSSAVDVNNMPTEEVYKYAQEHGQVDY